jgi:hypothetical protein
MRMIFPLPEHNEMQAIFRPGHSMDVSREVSYLSKHDLFSRIYR